MFAGISAQSDASSDLRAGTRQVFVFALLVRLLFGVVTTPFFPTDPGWDEFFWSADGYTLLAQTMVEHGKYAFGPDAPPTTFRPPLFPLLVAAAYRLTRNLGVAVLLVNALAAAATCALLYRFVLRTFPASLPRRAAAWAAVLLPMSVLYVGKSFSDSVLALTVIGAAVASLRLLERGTWRDGLTTGVWLGLGALTKSILLPIPALLAAYAVAFRRRSFGPAVLACLVTLSVLAPWGWRTYALTGRFEIAGGGGFNLLFGTHLARASGTSEEISKQAFASLARAYHAEYGVPLTSADVRPHHFWDVAPLVDERCAALARTEFLRKPWLLPLKLGVNAVRFWYLSTSPMRTFLALLMHIPLLLLAQRELRRWVHSAPAVRGWLIAFIAAYVGMYLIVNVASVRYALPVLLLLTPFAGAAAERRLRAHLARVRAPSTQRVTGATRRQRA